MFTYAHPGWALVDLTCVIQIGSHDFHLPKRVAVYHSGLCELELVDDLAVVPVEPPSQPVVADASTCFDIATAASAPKKSGSRDAC